jgi:hypothetical protein
VYGREHVAATTLDCARAGESDAIFERDRVVGKREGCLLRARASQCREREERGMFFSFLYLAIRALLDLLIRSCRGPVSPTLS